jgi:acyl carrier protein
LQVVVSPLTEDALPRAAQLTQRTNQFNFTTVRRSEADLQALLRNGSEECFIVQVSDRFGDYGIVGVLIFSQKEQELILDTFLLSCRVLGRGVEHRVMAWLGQVARERGVPFVTVAFEPTKKNRPAQQFLESLGPDLRFRSADLATLEWKPPSTAGNSQPAASKQPAVRTGFRSLDFTRIAANLSAPAKILEEISTANGAGAHASASSGMTETERKLAVIWAELLERSSVTATDNFFDLGGHSLLAVLLLLRIKEAFGVELPIDDVYSGSLTLADLATRIEMFRMGNVDSAEYERLLEEIEGLSEEEVQALLAAESPSPSSEPRP